MRQIIGVDPGGTTGIAMWNIASRGADWCTQLPAEAAVHELWHVIEAVKPIAVAVERFTISTETLRKTQQQEAIRVAGALQYFCARFDLQVPYYEFAPADAKRLITDGKLDLFGALPPSSMDHARDALRQALMGLQRVEPTSFEELLRGVR